jgi:hypothetical protein
MQLAYLWESRSFCRHLIEFPLHWRILGISSWQIQHCIFANRIWQTKWSRWYWVLLSEYETWAHIFLAKPQLLLAYHWSSGTHVICIPESQKLKLGLGNHRSNAAFAAGICQVYDGRSCTTEILNSVQNELLGYEWSQLWHAASHYECIIPADARLKSDK